MSDQGIIEIPNAQLDDISPQSSQESLGVPEVPEPVFAPPRQPLARKRRAATNLSLIETRLNQTMSPPKTTIIELGTTLNSSNSVWQEYAQTIAAPVRVPSSLSISSDGSLDSASDDDSSSIVSTDNLKRSRYDSQLGLFEDEHNSLSQSDSPDLVLGSGCVSESHVLYDNRLRAHVGKNHILTHNEVIGDFRIVGAGRDAKAVHLATSEVFNCQVLTVDEALSFTRVMMRLDESRKYYHKPDLEEMREAILPSSCEVVEDNRGRIVMFSPLFTGTLHAFATELGALMTESDVQPIFTRLTRMMCFCHRVGILLRVLKPKNLVFYGDKKIRLLNVFDCHVCSEPDDDTINSSKGCSPAYVSPEVISLKGEFSGQAADVWTLGVLLYLLLLGRYPFYDSTPAGVFHRIKQAKVVIPPNACLSKFARLILHSLLRRHPGDRPNASDLVCMTWQYPAKVPCRGASAVNHAQQTRDELHVNTRVMGVSVSQHPDPSVVPDRSAPAPQSAASRTVAAYMSALANVEVGGVGAMDEMARLMRRIATMTESRHATRGSASRQFVRDRSGDEHRRQQLLESVQSLSS